MGDSDEDDGMTMNFFSSAPAMKAAAEVVPKVSPKVSPKVAPKSSPKVAAKKAIVKKAIVPTIKEAGVAVEALASTSSKRTKAAPIAENPIKKIKGNSQKLSLSTRMKMINGDPSGHHSLILRCC